MLFKEDFHSQTELQNIFASLMIKFHINLSLGMGCFWFWLWVEEYKVTKLKIQSFWESVVSKM